MGMTSGALESTIRGVTDNSAYGHASGNNTAEKEWEVVKDQLRSADIDWSGNPLISLANAAQPVKDYVNKWYPNAGIDYDKLDHYAVSLLIAEQSNKAVSFGLGFMKEVADIFGTGFDTADLRADIAGVMGYDIPTAVSKGLIVTKNPVVPAWYNPAFMVYAVEAGGGTSAPTNVLAGNVNGSWSVHVTASIPGGGSVSIGHIGINASDLWDELLPQFEDDNGVLQNNAVGSASGVGTITTAAGAQVTCNYSFSVIYKAYTGNHVWSGTLTASGGNQTIVRNGNTEVWYVPGASWTYGSPTSFTGGTAVLISSSPA